MKKKNENIKLIKFAKNEDEAQKNWQNSQFEIADIVLSLIDKKTDEGLLLYSLFGCESFLKLMNFCICDFKLIKNYLGINGNYIERKGDIFSNDFKAVKHPEVLTLSTEEMQIKAKNVYNKIIKEIHKKAQKIAEI